jgi:hypothetical protein
MKAKPLYSKLFIAFLVMTLQGCPFPVMWSNPGYMVSIEIPKLNRKDVALAGSVLRDHSFNTVSSRVAGERCTWYKKEVLTSEQSDYPFVKAAVCFDETEGTDTVRDFRVLIMNEWQGKEPQLKQEIDSTADILIAELKKLSREEKITVERKATGPPF